MADVLILRRCGCGAPGRPRHVLANGKPIGEADVCDRCMGDVNAGRHAFQLTDKAIRLFESEGGAFHA